MLYFNLLFIISFSGLSGCVLKDKEMVLKSNNHYFDVNVKYSPTCFSKVSLMIDATHSRDRFEKLQQDSVQITLKELSPMKGERERQFLNPNIGGQ